MSIVRYNSDDNHLSVVHHNTSVNSVVVYNSLTNNLELVRLEDSVAIKNNTNRSHGEPGSGPARSRRPSVATSEYEYEFVCPDCGYQCKIDVPLPQPSSGTSGTHGGRRPSSPGSGDFLRSDYFKLLAQIEAGNDTNRDLILSIFRQSQPINLEQIPVELINQGYFGKFFSVLGILGSGSNGKVFKVEHKLFNLNLGVFAVKKIPIGNHFGNLVRILNEVKFLYNLSESGTMGGATNVIKYNHVWLEVDQMSEFGPKVPVVFILFEYCDGGTLDEFVEELAHPKFNLARERLNRRLKKLKGIAGDLEQPEKRLLNDFEIYKIFKDVLTGLGHLHGLKILHRDLKPSNCLFKTKFPVDYKPAQSLAEAARIPGLLVSDFGESIMENTKRSSTGSTGTLEFCAPELFEPDGANPGRLREFSYQSDVYSLGMILYYLCFAVLPFKSNDQTSIRNEILEKNIFEGMELLRSGGILPDWIALIRLMANPDPEQRPDCSDLQLKLDEIAIKLNEYNEQVGTPSSPKLKTSLYSILATIPLLAINTIQFQNPIISNIQYVQLGLLASTKDIRVRHCVLVYQLVLLVYLLIATIL